ncbi:hypothetical protein ACLOJK_019032 [Asimina triloba]
MATWWRDVNTAENAARATQQLQTANVVSSKVQTRAAKQRDGSSSGVAASANGFLKCSFSMEQQLTGDRNSPMAFMRQQRLATYTAAGNEFCSSNLHHLHCNANVRVAAMWGDMQPKDAIVNCKMKAAHHLYKGMQMSE